MEVGTLLAETCIAHIGYGLASTDGIALMLEERAVVAVEGDDIAGMLDGDDIACIGGEAGRDDGAAVGGVDGLVGGARNVDSQMAGEGFVFLENLTLQGREEEVVDGRDILDDGSVLRRSDAHLVAVVLAFHVLAEETVFHGTAVDGGELLEGDGAVVFQFLDLAAHFLAAEHATDGVEHPLLVGDLNLEGVDGARIGVGLLHHADVGVARYELAQGGEGDEDGGEDDEDDDGDADGDKEVDARQLEGEFLLEGVGIHHDEAVLMLDDVGQGIAFELEPPLVDLHAAGLLKKEGGEWRDVHFPPFMLL